MKVWPSPNAQVQVVGRLDEESVMATASGAVPVVGLTEKAAIGPLTATVGTAKSCADDVEAKVID